jgi:DNA polymerase III epsilon subunit-like protein
VDHPTVVFLDTETTGLDPERHEVWEIGCIVQDHRDKSMDGEWLWQLQPNLALADPTGLRIGRYYEREQLWRATPAKAVTLASPWWREDLRSKPYPSEKASPGQVAHTLAIALDGAHMVGAVPSFDAAFLAPFLRRHGEAPTWHYHLVDVEAMAAGHAQAEPPWNSDDLSRWVGVDPVRFDRHTALGDARWAKAIYEAVLTTK